jgi:hypothetical protein
VTARQKEQRNASNKRRKQERRAWIQGYKMATGCALCGFKAHPEALQLHHLDPTQKTRTFGNSYLCSWDTLRAELVKCQILCANCHAIVEAGKRGGAGLAR